MSHFYEFKRPSGQEITVEYEYSGGSSDYFAGGYWMPGDDPEVEFITAFDDAGDVILTDDEYDAASDAIISEPPDFDQQAWDCD